MHPIELRVAFTDAWVDPNPAEMLAVCVMFGILKGYQAGYDVYKMLNIKRFKTVKNIYGGLGSLALGIIIAYSVLQSGESGSAYAIVFALSLLSAYFYKRNWQSVYRSLAFPVIFAVIIGIIVENL